MDKYIYYVEGDNEKKVVDTLKERGNEYIVSGKSNIFNIIQEKIKKNCYIYKNCIFYKYITVLFPNIIIL